MSPIVPLFINGKEILGSREKVFPVESPFLETETLYSTQGATSSDTTFALESSHEAFFKWRDATYIKKRDLLNKVGHLLSERREKFKKLLVENGLPEWFAEFNIEKGIEIVGEYSAIVSSPKGTIPQTSTCSYALVLNEPIGPVVSIAPWNAPLVLGMRAIAGPVAAGCSVVLKSSESSPLLHLELVKLFHDAGAYPGLVNVIHHRPEDAISITNQLISSKLIKKVTFTGSSQVGKSIATMCARELKPVLLELGGKCASIVTKSADIQKAVKALSFSALGHNGQICMSTERVFVERSVYDEFIKELQEWLGNPEALGVPLPQRSAARAKSIQAMIQQALDNGAKSLHGNNKRNGSYLKPVVLADVKEEHEIYDQESFGPVFYITKVGNVDEAIQNVNESAYGLSSSVWTTNVLEGIEIARKIESGAVHINNGTLFDESTVPHGGVKSSGYGRFNSSWGLSEFQYVKTVSLA